MRKILFFIFTMCHTGLIWAQTEEHKKLNIDELFELAETNNRSIRLSDFAIDEAQQSIKVAKNAMLPTFDLSFSASFLGDAWLADRDFSNGQNADMPHFGNNFAIEASQIIYAGGAIKNAVASAKLHQQAAQVGKEITRQNIRFLLIGNYLELFKLQNQEEVYLKNIEQTQKLVSDIQNKQREGLVLKNDITRYELQLQSLQLSLVQVRNGMKIVNNKLTTLLGLSNNIIIDIDKDILIHLPETSDESYWQNMALDTAPSLRLAKVNTELAKKGESIVRANKIPSIALFAGDQLNGPITTEVPPIDKNLNYWYVGIGLKYNIASLYTTNKSLKKAKIATQMSTENEALQQENLQIEINEVHTRFSEAFTILQTQIKSLELATQNYDVINNRYLNDLALITDMLDASNSKLEAELQMANARINILFNYYNLKRISGNL